MGVALTTSRSDIFEVFAPTKMGYALANLYWYYEASDDEDKADLILDKYDDMIDYMDGIWSSPPTQYMLMSTNTSNPRDAITGDYLVLSIAMAYHSYAALVDYGVPVYGY